MGVMDLLGDEGDRVPGVVGEQGLREGDGQPGQKTHLKGLMAGTGWISGKKWLQPLDLG